MVFILQLHELLDDCAALFHVGLYQLTLVDIDIFWNVHIA